jgi:hypothetical protein
MKSVLCRQEEAGNGEHDRQIKKACNLQSCLFRGLIVSAIACRASRDAVSFVGLKNRPWLPQALCSNWRPGCGVIVWRF